MSHGQHEEMYVCCGRAVFGDVDSCAVSALDELYNMAAPCRRARLIHECEYLAMEWLVRSRWIWLAVHLWQGDNRSCRVAFSVRRGERWTLVMSKYLPDLLAVSLTEKVGRHSSLQWEGLLVVCRTGHRPVVCRIPGARYCWYGNRRWRVALRRSSTAVGCECRRM